MITVTVLCVTIVLIAKFLLERRFCCGEHAGGDRCGGLSVRLNDCLRGHILLKTKQTMLRYTVAHLDVAARLSSVLHAKLFVVLFVGLGLGGQRLALDTLADKLPHLGENHVNKNGSKDHAPLPAERVDVKDVLVDDRNVDDGLKKTAG